jgi:hypothetical protein
MTFGICQSFVWQDARNERAKEQLTVIAERSDDEIAI